MGHRQQLKRVHEPGHRAGNMTSVPKPAAPTGSYAATYDAWNRLVQLSDGSDTVSEYAYDGAKRRIVQKSYTAGTLAETRHLYYTQPSQWQVVEERIGSSSDADRQFVWGLRYVDDCLLRDRDTDANGSLDERLYALQDGNWNVTGLVDPDGDVQERFAYTAYGAPLFLAANFTPQGASGSGWETLYCGYRHEAATGLFHVRHRVLHPLLGTWVQRDPLGYMDSHSLYSYAASIPLLHSDPSGLAIPVIIISGACAACFESLRAFLMTAHDICENSDSAAGYSVCMLETIAEMESQLGWHAWVAINTSCLCCGGGITGAVKKFVKKLAQKWTARRIATCQATHAAYKALTAQAAKAQRLQKILTAKLHALRPKLRDARHILR
ncbi:MAG: RHS repeat-associated core domain-containing protein [Planctomyces sp.]|nr:RHS repeat-associated core domain-containing protein [Planctomyces sp.]